MSLSNIPPVAFNRFHPDKPRRSSAKTNLPDDAAAILTRFHNEKARSNSRSSVDDPRERTPRTCQTHTHDVTNDQGTGA